MELTNINDIKQLLIKYGFVMKKKYGQNFLINKNIVEKIAENGSDGEDCGVIEIGPGIGVMTRELSKRAKKVVAVEIDSSLLPILDETLSECKNVTLINCDVMKLDMKKVIEEEFEGCSSICVCANLPYYITTPILMMLLESTISFKSVTVMIQKEVADRICSDNLDGDYGAIAAMIAYYGAANKLFSVAPGNFYPAPTVTSTVMKIELYSEKPYKAKDLKTFSRVIKGSFGQRRKTLLNALSSEFPEIGKANLSSIIQLSGHNILVRGERLSVAQFVSLSNNIYDFRAKQSRAK